MSGAVSGDVHTAALVAVGLRDRNSRPERALAVLCGHPLAEARHSV